MTASSNSPNRHCSVDSNPDNNLSNGVANIWSPIALNQLNAQISIWDPRIHILKIVEIQLSEVGQQFSKDSRSQYRKNNLVYFPQQVGWLTSSA